MQFDPGSVPPRAVVAGLWTVSMVVSWAAGTLLFGFDLGTTLAWLALTVSGPLLVWGFVAALDAHARSRPGLRERVR